MFSLATLPLSPPLISRLPSGCPAGKVVLDLGGSCSVCTVPLHPSFSWPSLSRLFSLSDINRPDPHSLKVGSLGGKTQSSLLAGNPFWGVCVCVCVCVCVDIK